MKKPFELPTDYFTRKQLPVIVANIPCKRTFFVEPNGTTREAFKVDTKKVILNHTPPRTF